MINTFYVEITRNVSGRYSLLYYLLQFSGNYQTVVEDEKYYGTEVFETKDLLVSFIADIFNSYTRDLNKVVILTDSPYLSLVKSILQEVNVYLYVSRDTLFTVKTLSEYCNQGTLSAYELYNVTFGAVENVSKLEVIDRLIVHNSLVLGDIDCFLVFYLVKRGDCRILTASWIKIGYSGEVTLLGTMSEYFSEESGNYFTLNKYICKLKLALVKSGVSLNSIYPIFYSIKTEKHFKQWLALNDVSIFYKCPIFFKESLDLTLSDNFKRIIGDSRVLYVRLLLESADSDILITSGVLTKILTKVVPSLGLKLNSEKQLFITDNKYYKDFSTDTYVDLNLANGFKYGIMLDCEGSSLGGCSEVGGLIFAYGKGTLIKLEAFHFRQVSIADGLSEVVSNFERISGRYLPVKGIPVLTYGGSDKIMIQEELSQGTSRQLRRKLSKSFEFIDCQSYIVNSLVDEGMVSDSNKLSAVAKYLGVKTIKPKHSALNDAKTLFNVLSAIYLLKDEFILS